MTAELRFRAADVSARICAPDPGAFAALSNAYESYPDCTTDADVVVSVRCQASFRGQQAAVRPPAFESRELSDGDLELWRQDAAGRLKVPLQATSPVSADFTLKSPHSVEAPIRIAYAAAIPRVCGLLLHASAVELDGRALIFTGPSGGGKSTIARLLGDPPVSWRVLADELIAVRPIPSSGGAGSWHAFVVPFDKHTPLPHGKALPLASVHVLHQATADERAPLDTSSAMRALLRNVLVYAGEPRTSANVLAAASALATQVPFFALRFRKSSAVARVLMADSPVTG